MSLFTRIAPSALLAFLVGVFFSSFLHISHWVLGFLMLFAFACLCAQLSRKSFVFIAFAVCILGFTCGVFRFTYWSEAPRDKNLDAQTENSTLLTGIINDEPDVREGKTHLTIALRFSGEASGTQAVYGNVLAIVSRYPEYHYGDVLELHGKLSYPEAFAGKDGRIFDYPTYLATKGIHYEMLYPSVVKIEEGKGNPIVASLFLIKEKFIHTLGMALPEPHNALIAGLLLGGKQSLGATWLERFRVAGIIHIIVLSGYNMTIVAEWLVVVFSFLGFFGSLVAGGLGIIFFAIMTGGGATVMRAGAMAILVLLARATGRTYTMGRALLIAAACMVLLNPSILAFDPSFQLSFLASLGLVFVAPVVKQKITLFKHIPILHEVLVSTLATQMSVLPVLLYQTGMLSLVALPVNLLVLPLIPLTMLLGFVAGVIAFVLPTLGFIVALPAYALLSWILGVAKIASAIPYAAITMPVGPLGVFMLYACLLYWLYREYRLRTPISLSRSHQGHLLSSMSDKTERR